MTPSTRAVFMMLSCGALALSPTALADSVFQQHYVGATGDAIALDCAGTTLGFAAGGICAPVPEGAARATLNASDATRYAVAMRVQLLDARGSALSETTACGGANLPIPEQTASILVLFPQATALPFCSIATRGVLRVSFSSEAAHEFGTAHPLDILQDVRKMCEYLIGYTCSRVPMATTLDDPAASASERPPEAGEGVGAW